MTGSGNPTKYDYTYNVVITNGSYSENKAFTGTRDESDSLAQVDLTNEVLGHFTLNGTLTMNSADKTDNFNVKGMGWRAQLQTASGFNVLDTVNGQVSSEWIDFDNPSSGAN